MVRVRKDATTLTAAERDRFLSAFARFNDRGLGRFSDFRNVHTQAGSPEAHFRAGFLPWHRSFLLDLERELQDIDPTVAMPYWRFDRPARSLFRRDFMGVASATGTVQFAPTNPCNHGPPMERCPASTELHCSTPPRRPPLSSMSRAHWPLAAPDRAPISKTSAVWRAIRTALPIPAFPDPSPRYRPRPRTRCFSCCTPMSTGFGRSGNGFGNVSTRLRPPRLYLPRCRRRAGQ